MERQSGWQRLDAQRWLHVIYLIQTTLLSVAALFAVLAALGLGALLAIPLAVAPATLMGVLARAWRPGRQWSWWASSVLAFSGAGVLPGRRRGPGAVPGVMLNAGLSHPACRRRIRGPVEDIRPERDPAAAWDGRDY